MADAKLTALTETTAPATTDDVYIVVTPGGTPASRRCTIANLKIAMGAPALHGCKVYNGATQSVNGNDIPLTFGAEEFDSDAYHDNSTNPTRITIPTGLGGYYLLTAGVYSNANGGTIGFMIGGTTKTRGYNTINGYTQVTTVVSLTAGQYVEVTCTATSATVGHATLADAQAWASAILLDI